METTMSPHSSPALVLDLVDDGRRQVTGVVSQQSPAGRTVNHATPAPSTGDVTGRTTWHGKSSRDVVTYGTLHLTL